ncbi:MAG: TetR family transcriptional regulator [Methylomonas sp.]|nr:TetR family transcriptional regulator [Flavobacterium sp.]PPD17335.1 MAG: TetR family transcriptional regulator [Methylobacter sp.]PPD36361.1 MAG: TetR family transcriptional regulator [Methylomonas sp.]
MRLLFISRAYPPVVGGLENQNFAIHQALSGKLLVKSIINTKGKKNLALFLALALYKALFKAGNAEVILLGDGVLAVIGWVIKMAKPKARVVCIIHGLDVTYTKPIYQFFWLKIFLPRLDAIIAVSQATAQAAIDKGIINSKITIIPNAVSSPEIKFDQSLLTKLKSDFKAENQFVLLTIGRLVKRKGVNWFIQNVMPKIKDQYIYWVAGDGPERMAIEKTIEQYNLQNNVVYFGLVSEEMKAALYASADCFVQPNIQVMGDMEGFGLAVLEANSYGLPVLAAKLEGLIDAITDNQNGWFFESENANSFVQKLQELKVSQVDMKAAGEQAKAFSELHFSWDKIADQYIAAFKKHG